MNQQEIEDQEQDNVVISTNEQYLCMPGKEEPEEAINILKNNKASVEVMIGAKLLKKRVEPIANYM